MQLDNDIILVSKANFKEVIMDSGKQFKTQVMLKDRDLAMDLLTKFGFSWSMTRSDYYGLFASESHLYLYLYEPYGDKMLRYNLASGRDHFQKHSFTECKLTFDWDDDITNRILNELEN